MDQAGGPDVVGSRVYVPGYTLDRGIKRRPCRCARRRARQRHRLACRGSPAQPGAVLRRRLSPPGPPRHGGACACLRHQHLLSVIAFDDRHAAIVYEWVDAITVRHLIDVSGRLTATAAMVVFDDTLAALEALHAAGVMHRDVTPNAVLLDTDGTGIPARRGAPCPTTPSRLAIGDPAVHGPGAVGGQTAHRRDRHLCGYRGAGGSTHRATAIPRHRPHRARGAAHAGSAAERGRSPPRARPRDPWAGKGPA